MSQWADGGIVATKPYVSSGSYIHKMSNYCEVVTMTEIKEPVKMPVHLTVCTGIFWRTKKNTFRKNNRMAMMLRLLDKIPALEKEEIKNRALSIIQHPDDF